MNSMMLGSITPIGAYGTSRDNRHIRSRLNIEVIIDQIRESAVRNQRWNKDLFFLRFPGHMNVNSRFILFGCDLDMLCIATRGSLTIRTNIIGCVLWKFRPLDHFLQHGLYIVFHIFSSCISSFPEDRKSDFLPLTVGAESPLSPP